MRIEEVMTSPVVVVTPETPVKEVAALLVHNGFGAVPVTSADGTLIGIITEADLIALETAPDPRRHARRDLPEAGPAARTAADVMTTPVIAARVDTDVSDTIEIMLSEHLTRIPVLDERDRLAGLVSRSDLLRPLVRPDRAIEADIRRLLAYLAPKSALEVGVDGGEVTIAGATGASPPLFDHLVRAVPGVIGLRHVPAVAGPEDRGRR